MNRKFLACLLKCLIRISCISHFLINKELYITTKILLAKTRCTANTNKNKKYTYPIASTWSMITYNICLLFYIYRNKKCTRTKIFTTTLIYALIVSIMWVHFITLTPHNTWTKFVTTMCTLHLLINKEVSIAISLLLPWFIDKIYTNDNTHIPTTHTNLPNVHKHRPHNNHAPHTTKHTHTTNPQRPQLTPNKPYLRTSHYPQTHNPPNIT